MQSNSQQPAADGPLAHLHKMSTTAGISSQDYVAVNLPSVFAVILGLVSALAILDPIWLIVPVAGVICAILALRQIGNSNGTQTGRSFAWLGMLLCVAMVSIMGTRQVLAAQRLKADQAQIAELIETLGQHIIAERYESAYHLFSDRFQQRPVTLQQFTERWKNVRQNELYGKLRAMTWNGRVQIEVEPRTGSRFAYAMALFRFDKIEEPLRQQMSFRQSQGKWLVEDVPQLFPASQQPGQ